jgi:hypothetical protein
LGFAGFGLDLGGLDFSGVVFLLVGAAGWAWRTTVAGAATRCEISVALARRTVRRARAAARARAARPLAFARVLAPALTRAGAGRKGTLVSPTIAGSAGAASGWVGSTALDQSHADPLSAIAATPTFAPSTIQIRSRAIIGASARPPIRLRASAAEPPRRRGGRTPCCRMALGYRRPPPGSGVRRTPFRNTRSERE